MIPEHAAEGLSSDPGHKRVAFWLMEKVRVFNKLCSGMNYSAVGQKSSVSDSTISIK